MFENGGGGSLFLVDRGAILCPVACVRVRSTWTPGIWAVVRSAARYKCVRYCVGRSAEDLYSYLGLGGK